jgi:hypothetical protein
MFFNWFKKEEPKKVSLPTPVFNLDTVFRKLYEANGEKGVILTADEASELYDYLEYVSYLHPKS